MKPWWLLAGLLMVGSASAVPETVPDVIVERHVARGGRRMRVTLFDNRVAVATVREGELQVFFRKVTLNPTEYDVYLEAMAEVAGNLGRMERNPPDAGEEASRIVLQLPGEDRREVVYSSLQVLDLPTARIVGVLDDLEMRVSNSAPNEDAVLRWDPAVGDRVALFVGGEEAVVTEVRDNGVILLEQKQAGMILIVPPEERIKIIFEVLDR